MSDQLDVLGLLNGRSKNLDTRKYGYPLHDGGGYGMDVAIEDEPVFDENKMSMWIPYADGRRRDGVGDLLEVGGIDTSRHQKNSIVLFDHAKQIVLPIGTCENPDTKAYENVIDPVAKMAKLNCYFYQGKGLVNADKNREHDHALFCEQLYDLAVKRYIRSGSIGYQVKAARELNPDYETGTPKGLHLLSTLMLEGSLVVLPANQDTVVKCLAMPTVCGKPLSPYLRKSLEPYAPEKKAVLGWEQRQGKDLTVPVPHGDLSKTDVPPADWVPGAGADCKNGDDPKLQAAKEAYYRDPDASDMVKAEAVIRAAREFDDYPAVREQPMPEDSKPAPDHKTLRAKYRKGAKFLNDEDRELFAQYTVTADGALLYKGPDRETAYRIAYEARNSGGFQSVLLNTGSGRPERIKALRQRYGVKRCVVSRESDGWYARFGPEFDGAPDYRGDLGPFESEQEARDAVRREHPALHVYSKMQRVPGKSYLKSLPFQHGKNQLQVYRFYVKPDRVRDFMRAAEDPNSDLRQRAGIVGRVQEYSRSSDDDYVQVEFRADAERGDSGVDAFEDWAQRQGMIATRSDEFHRRGGPTKKPRYGPARDYDEIDTQMRAEDIAAEAYGTCKPGQTQENTGCQPKRRRKALPDGRKNFPTDPHARKILHAVMMGTLLPRKAVEMLMGECGMRRQDAEREVTYTVQAISSLNQKKLHLKGKSNPRVITPQRPSKEFEEGWKAGRANESRTANPYPGGTTQNRNWVNGWFMASDEEDFKSLSRKFAKGLQVKFNWGDNPAPTPYENRRIWISQNDGAPRQVTFRELHSMLGEEAARNAIKVSIRKGTSNWHEVDGVKSLPRVRSKRVWDDPNISFKVVAVPRVGGAAETLYSGPDEQQAQRIANFARRGGKYGAVDLIDSGLGATAKGQKSLDMLRKKHRTTKGLRRRLRKSAPGASITYVAAKDLDAARDLAESKGCEFSHEGSRNGFARVKLIGTDEGMDAVAKEFGRRIKSLGTTMPSKKDLSVNRAPGRGIDVPPEARRVLESAGLRFNYAKPGDSGGWHLVFPPHVDPAKVIQTLARAGFTATEMDNSIYLDAKALLGEEKAVRGHVQHETGPKGSRVIEVSDSGRKKRNLSGYTSFEDAEKATRKLNRRVERTGEQRGQAKRDSEEAVAQRREDRQRIGTNIRAERERQASSGGGNCKPGQTAANSGCTPAQKTLQRRGKSMTDEEPIAEEFLGEKDMTDESNWPYGAQVMKRLIEDHKQLLQDYDEMHGPLEHPELKKALQKKLESIAGELDDWEAAIGKHYPDLHESIVGETGHKELTEDEEGEVSDELDELGGELDEVAGELDEEFADTEDKDLDTMDDPAIPADSDPEPEPSAEEALEGMESKRLSRRIRRKSLDEDEEEKALFARRKSACPCGKDPCECDEKGLKRRLIDRKDIEPAVMEEEVIETDLPSAEPKGLDSRELGLVMEAAGHAKNLSSMDNLDEEARMKSYHYGQTLKGMAQIDDLAEGKSEFVGDQGFWEEEAAEAEHKDLPPSDTPGEIAADMPVPEEVPGQPPSKALHPHRQACKDASVFFGDAARTKDWGETHKQDALAVSKALEEISAAPADGPTPPPEEAGFEVGEMGEKARKAKSHGWHKSAEEDEDETVKAMRKALIQTQKQVKELARMSTALNGIAGRR